MRYFCFIFFLLGALNVSAQQEISGKVTDERNMPLPGATITLKQASDAKVSAYAIADSLGKFSLKHIKAGNYQIESAFVTYKNEARPLTVGKETVEVQFFKLLPESRQLEEVTINGKKQAISVSGSKATMNVEQSSLAQSQSAYELLKSLPGVNINKDGEIRIKGKSGVTVMIDGEPAEMGSSQLKALLKGTPGTTLQSIEVMNNPPSGMDAAGTGGVINIIFKKKVKKGFNGSVSSNVSKGRYYRTNQSLSMSYGVEKWDLNLLYAYDFDHSRNQESLFRSSQNTDQPFAMSQLQLNPQKSKGHLLKLGLDHHFGEKNTLRFNLSFNDVRNPADGRTISRFGTGAVQDSLLDQRNELRNTIRNWDYGLKFRHKFTELKSLNASLQFNNLSSGGSEDYTISKTIGSRPNSSELRYRNIYPSKIDRRIIKIDYLQELKKGDQQIGKFEAGIKSSQTNINNSQFSENRTAGMWQNDPLRSNNFRYREAIQAAYAVTELKLEPWTFNAGLRGEYTHVRGETGTDPNPVRQNYFSLFPNALIGYKVNDSYNLSVSYNRRIERPDYDNLNPSIRYMDLYTTRQGNPKLKAQFSNNLELNQQFFSFIELTLGYSSIKNPIFSTFQSSPGAKSAYTTTNTGHQQQLQASLSFPIPGIDWWENYQSVYFYTSQFNANLETKAFKERGNTYGIYSYNSFKLPAGFNLELSGWYESGGLYANFRYKPVSEISMGANKKMLNDKLTIGVAVADVFYTGIFKAAVLSDHTQTFNLDSRTDSRQVKFSLSWNFGKKPKAERTAGQQSDEDSLPAVKSKQHMKPGKQ